MNGIISALILTLIAGAATGIGGALVLFRKKIRSRFIQDFLYYVPYAVLSAMTIPAVLYATDHVLSAAVGAAVAVVLAFFRHGLLTVALSACSAALAAELVMLYLL